MVKLDKELQSSKKNRLVKLIIPFTLFVFSITVRFLLKNWFYSQYDVSQYISEDGYYWETYLDADTYYQYYLYSFKHENWMIYDPSSPYPLSGYVYGPLFVYFLTILSYFVDLFFPNVSNLEIAWKTVVFAPQLFDSLSTIVLYYIVKYLASSKFDKTKKGKMQAEIVAIFSSIIVTFMPLILFYNDFLYLNSYMFGFFAFLAFYFLLKEKYDIAALWLAFSIMTKQIALFLLPFWFIYIFRQNKKKGLRFVLLCSVISIILALPWVFLYPESFLIKIFYSGSPYLTAFSIDRVWILWSTTPFHAFLYWGWEKAALVYYQLNMKLIPFIIFNLLSYFWIGVTGKKLNEDKTQLVITQALFSIGIHLFLSRGCYKYYDAFFVPFIIAAVGAKAVNLKNKWIRIGFLFSFNTWLFFLNLWIIIKIKWLHQFYVFLLYLSVLIFIKPQLFLYLFTKEAYTKLFKDIFYFRKKIEIKRTDKTVVTNTEMKE